MKVRLFDETIPVPEKEIILRMFRKYNVSTKRNEIIVGIVNKEGDSVFCGQLIAFTSDMRLIRRCCVTEEFGLLLNEDGQLRGEDD